MTTFSFANSFANSIEKREIENIGHKITITVDDITDDIMPLFEKSIEGDIKAKLEMYRKIYDRQAKDHSRKASEQVIIRGPFAKMLCPTLMK